MKRRALAVVTGIMILCFAAMITNTAYADNETEDGKIHDGVYAGNVDLSGMDKDEARQAIQDYVNMYYDKDITLTAGDKKTTAEVSKLGLKWDDTDIVDEAMGIGKEGNIVARYKQLKDLEKEPIVLNLKFTVDTDKLKAVVEDLGKEFNQEAVDASIKRVDGKFVVTEGQQGIVLDEKSSIAKVENYFAENFNSENNSIELVSEIQEPKGNVEDLKKIKDTLGSFSTVCGSGANGRVQNIINGTSKINGSIVYPGEEFSADAKMEPYTAETGYALGGAYENGTVVQSYGGGICQVSTTLYNAVLAAELKVTQRSNHSMTVAYVEPSKDAAIAGTWKDLKFVNNTDAPILIEGYVSGGTVHFNIYGEETRDSNRSVEYVSETLSTTEPGVTINAIEAPIGTMEVTSKGQTGLIAKLWKVVYVDGKEVSREEVNSSTYKATNRVINVGIVSDNAEAVSALNEAIASNNEEACSSIIAQNAAAAQAAADKAAADKAAADKAAADKAAADKAAADKAAEDKAAADKAASDKAATDKAD